MKSKKFLLGALIAVAIGSSAFNLLADDGGGNLWNGKWKICERKAYDAAGHLISREWYCCHTNFGDWTYEQCLANLTVGVE